MGFAARVALLCAVVFWTAGAARTDDLGTLLDRMRTKSGPVWQSHLASLSHLNVDGEVRAISTETQGLRFKISQCAGTLCAATYFDGDRLSSVDVNGTVVPQSKSSETSLHGLRLIASLAFLDPRFTDAGGRITDEGTATIEGGHYRELLIEDGVGVPMQVYVDPEMALIRYFRDTDDDSFYEYRDYRKVGDSVTLPFLSLQNGKPLERYDERRTLADSFVAPHGLYAAFDGPSQPIALEPDHTAPVFPCTLATIATHCLLDTGNSGLAMSGALAARLQAAPVGTLPVRGLGAYAASVVRVGPLLLGNVTFPVANYVVLPEIGRFGYDVVLGTDVLAATNVALDPVARTIQFGVKVPADAMTVPLAFQNFLPVVDVQLGQLDAPLALDTGDESNINLSYEFYQQHPELFSATEQRTVSGVGGSSIEMIGEIPQVRIGRMAVSRQRIGATQKLHGTAYGHLGAGFLQHFKVVLDYATQQLHLTPSDGGTTFLPR